MNVRISMMSKMIAQKSSSKVFKNFFMPLLLFIGF